MSTSGTYVFANPQSVEVIEDAFERIGLKSQTLETQKKNAAQRTINFILSTWPNRGLNLWTVQQGNLALNPNQSSYTLPNNLIAIMEATTRTSVRNLGGTPFSSAGGNAANAFDNNPQTACTQTAPNGYISYNWGQAQYAIGMVGIQSNATLNYSLVAEYSFDNVTWYQAVSIPTQSYPQSKLLWFIVSIPVSANLFRVRETGGATLNIQELYFNSMLNDTIMTAISRAEYVAIPNKSTVGRPSQFYIDRQINPVLYLWPTPNNLYNNMYYTYTTFMQDIGNYQNIAQIPQRFLDPLCAETAFMLALKYRVELNIPTEIIQLLKMEAQESFRAAAKEDRERVPLRIYGDYYQGWSAHSS